jgi:hypothetical protein
MSIAKINVLRVILVLKISINVCPLVNSFRVICNQRNTSSDSSPQECASYVVNLDGRLLRAVRFFWLCQKTATVFSGYIFKRELRRHYVRVWLLWWLRSNSGWRMSTALCWSYSARKARRVQQLAPQCQISRCCPSKKAWQTAQVEDEVLQMVQRDPTAGIRRIANRLGASQKTLWRTVHEFGLYRFHTQNVTSSAAKLSHNTPVTDCCATRSSARQFCSQMRHSSTKME